MSTASKKTKFDFDGPFQAKIVRLMYQDSSFAEAIAGSVKPDLFENPVHSWVVRQIRDCQKLHGHHITPTVLRRERKKALGMGTIKPAEAAMYKKFCVTQLPKPVPDRTYIKGEIQSFVEHQAITAFILDAVNDHLPKKNYNALRKRMSNIIDIDVTGSASAPIRPGLSYEKRIVDRASVKSEGITTGIVELDRLMSQGGMQEKQIGCVLAPTGRGKCLGKGTPVLLFDGSVKAVEDVLVGDVLMGPDSGPRRVLSLARGRSEMFEIQPVKGDTWVCNDVHVLTLVNTETSVVIDVPLDEYLGWSKTQKHLHKQFHVGVDFSEKTLPVDPYFLGLWFGDGVKDVGTQGVRVTTLDPEVEVACRTVAAEWGLRLERSDYAYQSAPTLRLVGPSGKANPLREAMKRLVGGRRVPRAYLTGTRAQRSEFLAGWLDSDGHLHYGGYDFIQKRRDYAEAVAFLARSLGLKACVSKCKKSDQNGTEGTYYRVGISGDCSKLPLRIARKRAAPRRQVKDVRRTGFSVTSKGRGDYYGFTLSGDGRFLLGDFTVTHNTNFLINLSRCAVLEGIPTLYVTLELDGPTISTRFDTSFTGVPLRNLRTNEDDLRKQYKKIEQVVSENLVVQEFPTGQATVASLKQCIRSLERKAFYPRLLVVDYADLLRPRIEYADSSYESQGLVYQDLRGLAMELGITVWTATQGNRKSMDAETDGNLDLSHMADSVKKAFVCDFVGGIAQSKKEAKFGKGRVVLLKNRNGPSGRELKIAIEHDICRFRSI